MNPTKHIKWTCPDIDACKAIVVDVQKEIDKALKWVDDPDAIKDQLEYMDRELYYLPDRLEDLRASNTDLRSIADELQDEVDVLQDRVADLEAQVETLEESVAESAELEERV